MIKKALSILFVGFVVQLAVSCDYDCNRPKPPIYMEYTDLMLNAKFIDLSDNRLIDIEDSIPRDKLRLIIDMQEEQIAEVAFESKPVIGFNSANALDCGPPLIYQDLIKQIFITMKDPNKLLPNKDVSHFFGYSDENIACVYTIEEYLRDQTKYEPKDYIRLSCTETDSLYSYAEFTVKVTLNSNKSFSKNTQPIIFKH